MFWAFFLILSILTLRIDTDGDGDGDGDADGASLKWKLHSGGPIVSNCYAMLC